MVESNSFVSDSLERPLKNLRLSVTDRCNLRCAYCMPEEEYTWLPREDILRLEEIHVLVKAFADIGVDKLRLTGGEPLLRRGLPELVRMLASETRIRDLAMTTNGILLAGVAEELRAAGLQRVSVSLDSLQRERFQALTRRDDLNRVRAGIEALASSGFEGTKIDTVVMRGFNDDELVDLIDYGRNVAAEVRFIEYMDVGGATNWSPEDVVSRSSMLEALEQHYGAIEAVIEDSSAPADRFRLPDGTIFGIIASTTAPFCRSCDRSRLTADGMWYLCLYAKQGHDLRRALRSGASPAELGQLIADTWKGRTDRGAEERLATVERTGLLQIADLRSDPHLEMHTRGG